MSRSFLVESLLVTDDVRNANSSSSSSSKHSQYMSDTVVDITDNQLSTRRNRKLNESLTHRNKLLNASKHALAGSQTMMRFDHQRQYHRSAAHHSSSASLPNHCVYFQPMKVAAAVDAYVQLQTLAASMRASRGCRGSMGEMTSAGCLADTHQRRRHMNHVPQLLKLAATSFIPCCRQLANYYHNYSQQQQQQQSSADMHHSCLTSVFTSTSQSKQNDAGYCGEFSRYNVMSTQTG